MGTLRMVQRASTPSHVEPGDGSIWLFREDGRIEVDRGAAGTVHGLWSLSENSIANLQWPRMTTATPYVAFRSPNLLFLVNLSGTSSYTDLYRVEILVFAAAAGVSDRPHPATGAQTRIPAPPAPAIGREPTAADCGGAVPSRVSYVVVIEISAEGFIVPGSLILRQGSGYTAADAKVRTAISTWRFERAPGSPPALAIATLHIERRDIR